MIAEINTIRPLTDQEVKRIDFNRSFLVETISHLDIIVDTLWKERFIVDRQRERILEHGERRDQVAELLATVRRGSFAGFRRFYSHCLKDSDQKHIAELLERGGGWYLHPAMISSGSVQRLIGLNNAKTV